MSNPLDTPPPLRKGDRFGNRLPVDAINAGIVARREQLGQPFMSRARQTPGSGGGASTPASPAKQVRVYDNLQGQHVAVRCLEETLGAGEFTVNLAGPFIDAFPLDSEPVDLPEGGCCGTSGVAVGLRILTVLADNRITDDDDEAVAVTMSGADPNGTVVLKIYGSAATIVTGAGGVPAVSVSATGQATVTGVNVTGHGRGVLRFEAQAFDANGDPYPPTNVAVTYSKGDNATELGWFTGLPATPDLVDASDTGASNTDNITADTTPTLSLGLQNTAGIVNGTGPEALIYRDGVLLASGAVTDFDEGTPINRTLATQAAGAYTLQLIYRRYDAAASGTQEWWSGASRPLYLTINPNATASEDQPRVWRLGTVETLNGRQTLTWLSACPKADLTQGEQDKLDSAVTATALAAGAFTTSTDPIPLDNFAIVSDPTSINPTAPTEVDQPANAVGGADNSVLTLRYTGAAWSLVSVDPPA